MKTYILNSYSFDELSDNAKNNAINNERENLFIDFIYDDAYKTVKAFNELFNLKEGLKSWLDCNTGNIDDCILELKGFRLQKYIMNNFGSTLFKRKYLKHGKDKENEPKIYHRMRRFTKLKNGTYSIVYQSNYKTETSAVLTGICYDDDILKPIYDFLESRIFDSTTFKDLLENCFNEIKKTIESEIEYMQGDEYITEQIIDNGYEFNKNGKRI